MELPLSRLFRRSPKEEGFTPPPKPLELMVTLWPSFQHFEKFGSDSRLSGIRLNSAMISNPELEAELELINAFQPSVPLWFDVKGRQLRITEAEFVADNYHWELEVNHPISVDTPTEILFKAGMDRGVLEKVECGGRRLILKEGLSSNPTFKLIPGESFHLRSCNLHVSGPQFTEAEIQKICKTRNFGFKKYFLSYVQCQEDVDQFLDWVGKDAEVILKIEDKKGLEYVASTFQKRDNLTLCLARGDLYVEVDWPEDILAAHRLVIERDPEALIGSRLLLSVIIPPKAELKRALSFIDDNHPQSEIIRRILLGVVSNPIPSCADFSELAWCYDIGFRKMMLCDELCLSDDLLETAVGAFDAFRGSYIKA